MVVQPTAIYESDRSGFRPSNHRSGLTGKFTSRDEISQTWPALIGCSRNGKDRISRSFYVRERDEGVCVQERKQFKRFSYHTRGVPGDTLTLVAYYVLQSGLYLKAAASIIEKVSIAVSSPNIAKPFHMGHLRSTIIGNFISNLHEHLGGKVVRINYLGDWGTQFGLLQVGLNMSNYTDEMIKQNPIQLLYQAYVTANQAAKNDSALGAKAREIFQSLEEGSFADIKKWENYRNYTVDELQRIYKRLGVTFDEYEWESMYSTVQIRSVLDQLEEKGILKLEEDGRKVVNLNNNRQATLVKSDGTTLYLTRDIAAALHRYGRHSFDRLLYVVENGQNDHFTALMGTMKQMDLLWAERMRHVKFGRIRGMSTRKGSVVFLKDVLDETRDLMHKKQLESPSMLYSLEQNCGAQLPTECDPSVLQETEAVLLVIEVARFGEVLNKSHEELEACVLVSYLFRLCGRMGQGITLAVDWSVDEGNLTNQAFKVLRIKDQDPHIASQRLLLFHSSRRVLQQGMNILGLKPLNEM
uniref:Probable arginine--tRNA ligase, mitochondrial n=1 Tax=Timema bartmani TaxID=61472 RepID=A0A7R9HYH6_9NEOP|nr:unnamed protein product [Timema bartmani]